MTTHPKALPSQCRLPSGMRGSRCEGFFKLHRRIFSHWLWEEPRELSRFEAFLDLLQLAAFEPTKRLVSGSIVSVPQGGIVASERFLSERWKWSRTKVRHFLGMLELDGMLKQQKDQQTTVLTLCNYKHWNGSENEKRPPSGPSEDHRETTERPNIRSIRKEEGKEHPPNAPDIAECETFAKSCMLQDPEFAASVGRQFHGLFSVNGWKTQNGKDLTARGAWKHRLRQMVEEEARKPRRQFPGPSKAATASATTLLPWEKPEYHENR